jgi:hypothetical protein
MIALAEALYTRNFTAISWQTFSLSFYVACVCAIASDDPNYRMPFYRRALLSLSAFLGVVGVISIVGELDLLLPGRAFLFVLGFPTGVVLRFS